MKLFKRKQWFILIALGVVMSILFSLRWILPTIRQLRDPAHMAYIPIRYGHQSFSDDYYYYGHISEILSEKTLSHDPCTLENKSLPTGHISYGLSLAFCSIGGWLRGSIEDAYRLNYLLWPFLHVLSLGILTMLLTGSAPAAYSFPLVALLTNSEVERTPNCLFTALPLTLLVCSLISLKRSSVKTSVPGLAVLILLLALSPLISIPNMVISASLFLATLPFVWKDRRVRKRWLACAVVAGLLSLPSLLLLKQALAVLRVHGLPFYMPPIGKYFSFSAETTFYESRKFILPLLGLWAVPNFVQKEFALIVLGLVLSFVLLTVGQSSYMGLYVLSRGAELIYTVVALAISFHFASRFVKSLKTWKLRKRTYHLLLLFVVVFVMSERLPHFVWESSAVPALRNDAAFRDLATWTKSSTDSGEVFVTLDFDLLTNLITYGPINEYIPMAVMSPTSLDERLLRYLETVRFYGFTSKDLSEMLEWMRPHDIRTFSQNQAGLMQLVLFYGRYYDRPMPREERDHLMKIYQDMLESPRVFSFRATHWIASRFDRVWIKPGSAAERLMQSQVPLYVNPNYMVYEIKP